MIETDIKTIKRHHVKTNKVLKDISLWQTNHEKEDNKHFEEIANAIKNIPTKEMIVKSVADAVKITVNGNIEDVKNHLKQQDIDLATLSKKIRPFDQAKTWVKEFAQIILYIGGLAIAISGIIELLRLFKVI